MAMNFIERHVRPLSAGIDWLTVSKKDVRPSDEFDDLATSLLHASLEEGEKVRLGSWMGYAGLRSPRCFYGWLGQKAVCWLSGPHTPAHTVKLIEIADNVSRLDLQMTVEHTPPDAALGRINFRRAATYEGRAGVRPIVTELHDTKGGCTISIGSRISDQYGRHYDKGVQAKLGPAGALWRFEVEYKRDIALKMARQMAAAGKMADAAARSVWQWWTSRGIPPTARAPKGCLIDMRLPARTEADPLEWFESKVSRTVRRAVDSQGLHPVLRALGLLPKVEDFYLKGDEENGTE